MYKLCVVVIILGAVVAIAGQFPRWYTGVISLIFGLFVMIFEYPRGKRPKGATIQRRYQNYISTALSRCGVFSRNYYARFVAYMILSVPSCSMLPTLLGGVSLIIASLLYFVAAYKGEHWVSADYAVDTQTELRNEPAGPPPRLPVTAASRPHAQTAHVYANPNVV